MTRYEIAINLDGVKIYEHYNTVFNNDLKRIIISEHKNSMMSEHIVIEEIILPEDRIFINVDEEGVRVQWGMGMDISNTDTESLLKEELIWSLPVGVEVVWIKEIEALQVEDSVSHIRCDNCGKVMSRGTPVYELPNSYNSVSMIYYCSKECVLDSIDCKEVLLSQTILDRRE